MLVSITRYPGPVTENILSSFRHAVQVKAMTSSVNWRNIYIVLTPLTSCVMCILYMPNIPATLMSKVSVSHLGSGECAGADHRPPEAAPGSPWGAEEEAWEH